MSDKAVNTDNMALAAAAAALQAPLDVLALLKLADEFYSKEDRSLLYEQYRQLIAADVAAFTHMQEQSGSPSGMTYEERVAKYGKAIADEQLEPATKAREARVKTMNAVSAFENEHRLLVRLLQAKASYSKVRYG
ncbi:hypothetical protein ACOTJQ_28905 [Achromobacter xylosoxidans]